MNTRPSLHLTPRDRALLTALSSYRFLSVPQLATLFFASRGAAESRLRRLLAHHLVVRVFMPVRPYDRRATTIYALGAAGARLLPADAHGRRPRPLSPREQRSGLFLDHTLRRNDLRICLTLLPDDRPRAHLTSWAQAPEEVKASAYVRVRGREYTVVPVVPDACFTLATAVGPQAFAAEIDMGTVRLLSMATRYRAYWRWWREGGPARRYGAQPFRVLTLTTTERRLDALRRVAEAAPDDGSRACGIFWFGRLDLLDLENPSAVLGAGWTVARQGPRERQPLLPDGPVGEGLPA